VHVTYLTQAPTSDPKDSKFVCTPRALATSEALKIKELEAKNQELEAKNQVLVSLVKDLNADRYCNEVLSSCPIGEHREGCTATSDGQCTHVGVALDVAQMRHGATINLAAGTFAWKREVACNGKTITLVGAGKGATILDAGGARRFFTLGSGCTLVLRGLSLRNGKASGSFPANGAGGAILVNSGGTLSARDVEFKGNSATWGGAVRVFGGAAGTAGGTASFTSCEFTSNSATVGTVLYVYGGGTATFASTLPANSFSGNPAINNNYGNCYKNGGTVTGSCS